MGMKKYWDQKAERRENDETAKTDKLIDQKVYELYGLTDEEIKIVEVGSKN